MFGTVIFSGYKKRELGTQEQELKLQVTLESFF